MQDDEWMYQLEGMEKLDEAVDPAEMAIQACIKGDYGEAVRLLGDATASVVEMYPSTTDSHTHREFSAINRPCDDVTFRNDNIDTNHCSRAQDGEGQLEVAVVPGAQAAKGDVYESIAGKGSRNFERQDQRRPAQQKLPRCRKGGP